MSFKCHYTVLLCSQSDAGVVTEEKIAQRTRSKHPLHDVSITSLEAGLGPVEGEDPPTPRELDPDELWWHQWLNSLSTDPLNGMYMYSRTALLKTEDYVCTCVSGFHAPYIGL